MRKTLFVLIISLITFSNHAYALISVTVTGNTNTVPVIAASYVSLSSAITALNSVTSLNGPVTFNLSSGSTETSSTQYLITQAGSFLYPITFQKTGSNANPKLTRQDGGIQATTGYGGFGDGVIRIDGTDNIHFNGLDITSASMGIEYGYYFHKPNGANGSQNVSIKNATVTMTKGTSALVIGIYINNGQTTLSASDGVTLTAASGQHMNFLITGNTIQNVHRGIYCYGYYANYIAPYYYDRDFTIGQNGAGNIIQNFGGGVVNISAGISSKYIINLNINYNTINNTAGGGVAHLSDLFGLDIYGSTGFCSFSNNAITLTNTTGEVNWISNYTFGFSLQIPGKTALIHSNVFGGSVASSNSYLIYNSVIGDNSFLSARNNTISGNINMAGTSGSIFGYYASSSSFYKQEVIGNTISNITTPSACYGIYLSGGDNDSCIIDSNIVTNLNTTSTVLPFIYGIYISNVTKCLVRDNIVSNLGSHYTAGIRLFYSSYNPSIEILRNKIYSLNSGSTSSSGSTLNGIYVYDNARPGSIKIHNNLIGLLTAPNCTSTNAISALETSCSSLTDSLILDIAHNTIYLDASSSTTTNFGTSGIHQNSSSNGNYERFIFRNNIVVNLSTPKGTGATVAFRRNSTNNSNYDARSNRNVYYSGIPSSTRLLFTNGTSSYFTLNGYKTYIASSVPTAERNSFTENVAFQSIVGSNANFLKFDTSVPTGVESGGYKVYSVKGDFLKSARVGDIGYSGSGLAPDLGAWELDGIIASPCNGIPASSSAIISNASPCSDSVFAISLSNLYSTGTTYQWQASTTDSSTGFVSINGATESYYITSANIDTWYRCIVTCSFGNQTITSSAVLANVSPLNGTYVISNTGSGNYLSFAAAIADLHCKNASGPVVFEVVDGQIFNETVNLSIRYNGNYPITFKKQSNGVNPKIRRAGTSATTNYILQLLGADHIIFDCIDFEQTGTAASSWVEFGIQLTNNGALDGAQYNSFKNGIITLTNASVNTIGVNCHSSSPLAISFSGTNSFNRFVNMTVQNSIQGFRFDNTSTTTRDDGNEVVGENGLRGNINTLGTLTASATVYGIYASEQRNFKVDAVDIFGCQNTSFVYGILCNTSDSSTQIISNNHIQFNTSAGSIRGISLYNLFDVKVFNNEINELSSSSVTSGNVEGLSVSCADSAFIYNNKIYNLSASGTTTGYVYGMWLEGSGKQLVYNNMISDLRASTTSKFPAGVAGLYTEYGTGGLLKFYYNSIYLNDVGTNTSYRCAGICSYDTTFVFDLRNNLVLNKSNLTTGSYAVGFIKYYGSPDKISTLCNNNIWYAGVPDAKHFIYYELSPSTTAQTLSQFKALSSIAPAESNSYTENTALVPSLLGEIRPDPVLPGFVEGRAQPISLITSDFESNPRHATLPDIGADEDVFTPNPFADCATIISPSNNLNNICPFELVKLTWNIPLSQRTIIGGYDIYFGTSATPPLFANTNNLFYNLPTLLGNTTYYWKIVAKYANGDAQGCELRSFTTSAVGITSVNNGQRCGPGIVNLSANGLGIMQWYSGLTSTTPIQTGNNFNPTLSSTTNYYVSAINGYNVFSSNVGKASLGTPSTAGASATEYLSFNVLSACIIDSVVVYPSSSGTVVLNLANSSGTTLLTATKVVTAAQIGTAVSVYVNWPMSVGNGYRIYKPSTSVNLLRNTSGAVYPYTLSGVLSIVSSSGGAAYYSWAYNWTVRRACESARQLVVATVNSTTSSKSIITSCNAYNWNISGLTYTSSGIYTYTSIPATGCLRTDSLVLTVGVSGNNPPMNIVSCGNYTWPINGLTYTNSGLYTATFINQNGCDSSWQLNLTLQSCISNLQLKLFLEGYYFNAGTMHPVLMNQGIGMDTTLVDFITIELRHPINNNIIASSNVSLNTNGIANANFAVNPGNYYIVIKHRNTIETWSANPIYFGSTQTIYDFTTNSNKAFGNNMIEVESGYWALYTADLNSDENVDMLDLAGLEADISNIMYGYFSSDLNGDGNVDLLDVPIMETNLSNFVSSSHP